MNGDAYVDIEAVRRAEAAILRFYTVVAELLKNPLIHGHSVNSLLDDRIRILKSEINELSSAESGSTSESDYSEEQYRLSELVAKRTELERILRLSKDLSRAQRNYQQKSRRMEHAISELLPSVKLFLSQVIEDLQSYMSVPSSGYVSNLLGDGHIKASVQSTLKVKSALPENQHVMLPPHFSWLNVDEIEPTDFLDESSKISNDQLRIAFQLLDYSILPAFKMFGRTIGKDWFYAQDQAKGLMPNEGLEIVYSSFFGVDAIVIDRRENASSVYRIINGRHRIAIARDLGWAAVPVIYTDIKLS